MMQCIPYRMGGINILLIYIWIPMRMHLNRSSVNKLRIFLIVNAYIYLMVT
ncbi:hypothetical protein BK764_21030 [Bacillus thuringiensis serovar israelensis]|uniref:Uncharacterized protein n=1 Tax=Bacillus thuringiensis TaxID=1428 RepID=A0A9X6TKX9_BACTU|nr:hypothetical protein ATN07_13900 [Bacillus thuringiensis serovar israelensis]EAO52556.1 Hypothetical protein RBTH_02215 [Bacillus thuringiensis serovar israelensis ATCC 35646]KQB21467.1 hypothetical protein AL712_17905 [Bacillus thuringiensis]OTX65211.1 hypothetical protein BK719_18215 [Bacillus thuringiensis serovar novosibirsk]RHW07758.1 hypothetical protein B7P27_16525 [Bacillus cereus]